jgi:hypothetical protein
VESELYFAFFPLLNNRVYLESNFRGLDGTAVYTIFAILASICALDLLIRMIEERVALGGEHSNVSKRFAQHEQYSKDILGSLTTIKNGLDKYIDFTKGRDMSNEYKELIESNRKKIEDAIGSAVKKYRPGRIGSLFGQIRLLLEYYAGITVFASYGVTLLRVL